VHCVVTLITLSSASSLRHFLRSFYAIILLENLVASPLISLMMRPRFPLVVSNYAFTYSASFFSRTLFSRYSSSGASNVCNPIILEINVMSICIGLSIQRMPPWNQETKFLMHIPTFLSRPKCGVSKRFIIPELYSLVIHYVGSSTSHHRGPIFHVLIR
jgi:hypothetical protein